MSPAHAAGAASVVEQLRAFLRDPAAHRAELGGGRLSLESGHHIFRFAQGKFPAGLAHDLPTHEREELRRAAAAFIREVCFREGATHYQLLCVPPGAKRDAIKENYHLLMALIHPDRAEGSHEAWPTAWAQRANHAYSTLTDDAARAGYDKDFGFADAPRAPSRRPARRRGRTVTSLKARFARSALVLGTVMGMLLLLDAWVDFPGEHFRFAGALRGRDGVMSTERPRFLGTSVVSTRDTTRGLLPAASVPHPDKLLAPLWHDPAPPAPPTAPARVAAAAPIAFVEAELAKPRPPPVEEPPAMPAKPSLPEAKLTNAQIEVVVARLIGYYEAGDTDKLMALLDPKEAGTWQTQRTRQAYLDFFRTTRERRLRVRSLDWQSASATARAQGQATVQAEYVDAPGSLERDVDVEMEIGLRDGQVKITRLSLFPNAP